jgi:ubiquinone biosynthesis protein COQ9
MDLEATREALLAAMLPHVTFDGWSGAALKAAARDLDLPMAEAINAFPGGLREVIAYFSAHVDAEMLAALESHDLEAMRVRDRVALAVRTRLGLLEDHKEAVRRGLSFLALPPNAALGARLLWQTVDAIWYAAGDRSTDYNYYSKRTLLSGVYSSTLLVWLNDQSEDQAESWAFLERRLDEVLKLGGRIGRNMKLALDLPERLICRRPRRPGRLRRSL